MIIFQSTLEKAFEVHEDLSKCKVLKINREIHKLINVMDSTISNVQDIPIIASTIDKSVKQCLLNILDNNNHLKY